MDANSRSQTQPTPVVPGPTRKAVNIVAMGSSRNDFISAWMTEDRPHILRDAETWCINYMGAALHCDRIVHVDPVHAYLGIPVVREMCEVAAKKGIPFYTSWPHPFYRNHVVYPFDEVAEKLGITYLNTTVAYTLALAMLEGYNEIGLFGCDFSYPDIHLAESGRACVEFLIGLGTQRGIKFAIAAHSTLLDMFCQQQPYGFFANPLAPPTIGGKLMSTAEIIAHCKRMRQPNANVPQPMIYTIDTATPKTVETLPVIAQGAISAFGGMISPTAPPYAAAVAPKRGNGLDHDTVAAPILGNGAGHETSDLQLPRS